MRAIKASLIAAYNKKRKNQKEKEETLVLQAIYEINLPKFVSIDRELFLGIINDIFPGVELVSNKSSKFR